MKSPLSSHKIKVGITNLIYTCASCTYYDTSYYLMVIMNTEYIILNSLMFE